MNDSLLTLLRRGGFILYARHGEATVGADQPHLDFWNCNTQRNLSEYGRRQAVYFGETLRTLRIPVISPVLVSPYCRAIETAQLAFGWGNLLIDPFLYELNELNENIPPTEQDRILTAMNARLEITPSGGSNEVFIAHGFPDNIGLGRISDMGTVVIKPSGYGNGYQLVAKLSLGELAGLT